MSDSKVMEAMFMLAVAALSFVGALMVNGRSFQFVLIGAGLGAAISLLFNIFLVLGRHRPVRHEAEDDHV